MKLWPTSYRSSSVGSSAYNGLRPGQRAVDQVKTDNWTVFQQPDGSWVYTFTPPYSPPAIKPVGGPSLPYAPYRPGWEKSYVGLGGSQSPGLGAPAIVGINPWKLAEGIGRAALTQLMEELIPWPAQMWNDLLPWVVGTPGSGAGDDGSGGSWVIPDADNWREISDCGYLLPPERWGAVSVFNPVTCPSPSIFAPGGGLGNPMPVDTSYLSQFVNRLRFYGSYPAVDPQPAGYRWWVYLKLYEWTGYPGGAGADNPPYWEEYVPPSQKAFPYVQPRVPVELWPLANPISIPYWRNGPLPVGWSNRGKHAQNSLPDGSRGGNSVPRAESGTGAQPGSGTVTVVHPAEGGGGTVTRPPETWHPRRPDGGGEKTKKGYASGGAAMRALYDAAMATTEFLDVVDCLWNSMPEGYRKTPRGFAYNGAGAGADGKLQPQEKLRIIYDNLDDLDVAKFGQCLVANYLEDAIAGRMFALGEKGYRRLTGRNHNTFTPA